jgi:lipopolysaccharide transport system ATP-binding protein
LNVATGGLLAKDVADRPVVRALDELNFELHEGERVGLMGHNGSGKSTLLQVLGGVYEPTSGHLIVRGRITSMLGITLGLDAEASGLENIYLRGALMGLTKSEIDARVDDIVMFSELGEFVYLPMRTYSSGMLMRLAFAIATSVEADVVLMDEWLSTGDASFVGKAAERINTMVGGARLAVIASHNLPLLREKCNVLITLEHGKILSVERSSV